MAEASDTPKPEGLRRAPKQERSRRMVAAIEEAARKILLESGSDALNTTSLELVSGVAKGSIFQYFSSLEAIKAEVFRQEIRTHFEVWSVKLAAQWEELAFEEGIAMIVDSALALQSALIRLDAGFYQTYSAHFSIWTSFDDYSEEHDSSGDLLQRFITRHHPSLAGDELTLRAIAMGRAIEQTSYHVLREHLGFLDQPHFRQLLLGMGMSFFAPELIE